MHVDTPPRTYRSPAKHGAQHRTLIVTTLLAATLSLLLCGKATAAATSPVGHCQLTLRVIVHRLSMKSRAFSAYTSSSGTASCTGTLGPWLMGGRAGWSTSSGTLRIPTTRVGAGTSSCQVTRASGAFWAEVPRYAWFHPPMTPLGGSFRLQSRNGGLDLIGSGHLIPTAESPVSSPFRFTGIATIAAADGQSCRATRWAGSLTFWIAVH